MQQLEQIRKSSSTTYGLKQLETFRVGQRSRLGVGSMQSFTRSSLLSVRLKSRNNYAKLSEVWHEDLRFCLRKYQANEFVAWSCSCNSIATSTKDSLTSNLQINHKFAWKWQEGKIFIEVYTSTVRLLLAFQEILQVPEWSWYLIFHQTPVFHCALKKFHTQMNTLNLDSGNGSQ